MFRKPVLIIHRPLLETFKMLERIPLFPSCKCHVLCCFQPSLSPEKGAGSLIRN